MGKNAAGERFGAGHWVIRDAEEDGSRAGSKYLGSPGKWTKKLEKDEEGDLFHDEQ